LRKVENLVVNSKIGTGNAILIVISSSKNKIYLCFLSAGLSFSVPIAIGIGGRKVRTAQSNIPVNSRLPGFYRERDRATENYRSSLDMYFRF
jgi:hypothetical protein